MISPFHRLALAALCALAPLTLHAETAPGFRAPVDRAFTATWDGSTQRYILLTPEAHRPGDPRDLLIALHGHGADRMQFAMHPRDECRAARDAAAEAGMFFVSPDYRAKTSWMGPAAEADLAQLIALLKSEFAIERVLLCGGSMGGSSALTFTALHPDLVDGVVALNATANHLEYENFQEAIAESFGGAKHEVPAEYHRRSAEYWPLTFTMPVALTTGGRDTAVPPDSVARLAGILQKLGATVLRIHRPEGGHATNYEDTRAALAFVLEHMRKPTDPAPAPAD
jgi:pimeloyl-ACP methyl ester carboxylesterase